MDASISKHQSVIDLIHTARYSKHFKQAICKQYLLCKRPTYTNAVRPYASHSHLRAVQIVPSVLSILSLNTKRNNIITHLNTLKRGHRPEQQ